MTRLKQNCFLLLLICQASPALAQDGFQSANLNQLLNQVDQQWQQVPVSGSSGRQASVSGAMPGQTASGYMAPARPGSYMSSPQSAPYINQTNAAPYSPYMTQPQSFPQAGAMPAYASAQGQAYNPMQASPFAGGGLKSGLQSGQSPFSKQNLLRIFLGGSSSSSSGSSQNTAAQQAKDSSITSRTEALLNRARNQQSQANSDAERARYGSSKWEKQNAASSARYHANDARAAADEAANISYNGPQSAKNYAAQARAAANYAQAAADRAAYNAAN